MSTKKNQKRSYDQMINESLRFIYQNDDRQLTIEEIAKVAGISKYHFHRIFETYMGETLGKFISRKKMEKIALVLVVNQDIPVTDLALEYGYESQGSLTKAFKKHFDMAPGQYRKQYTSHNFMRTFFKESKLDAKIVEIEPIKVGYVRKRGNYFMSAPAAWMELFFRLKQAKVDKDTGRYFALSHGNPRDENLEEQDLMFDACWAFDPEGLDKISERFEFQRIAGGRYATFQHVGPYEKLSDTFHKIYGGWVHNTKEKLRDAPRVVEYLDIQQLNKDPQKRESIIYIPLEGVKDSTT